MARKRAEKEQAEDQGADTPQSGGKVSKADAVRAAIADGIDTPDEGVQFIKERYGLDVSKQQFSSYKSQDKARQRKSVGQSGRQRRTPTPVAAQAAPSSNGASGLAIQVEAIKTLVDDLGVDQVVSIARLFGK